MAEAQRRARRTLPKSVYKAIIAGSERGMTLQDNLAAFGELGFSPHVAEAPAERDMGTTVMGQDIALPVIISPTGRAGGPSRGGGGGGPGGGGPRDGDRAELVRRPTRRGGGGGQPADVLSDLLVRIP